MVGVNNELASQSELLEINSITNEYNQYNSVSEPNSSVGTQVDNCKGLDMLHSQAKRILRDGEVGRKGLDSVIREEQRRGY